MKTRNKAVDPITKVLQETIPQYVSHFKALGNGHVGYAFPVAANDSVTIWHRLLLPLGQVGYYPLVIKGTIQAPPGGLFYQVLESARKDSVEDYFERTAVEADMEGYAEHIDGFYIVPPKGSILQHNKPYLSYGTIVMAIVPTSHCWEVPAFIPFGDWNDCPSSIEHIVVWKYWYEKYGAQVFGISRDTVQLYLEKPITDEAEALALAREQFLYCEDIITQGCGTLGNLARSLLDSKYWYFWWD